LRNPDVLHTPERGFGKVPGVDEPVEKASHLPEIPVTGIRGVSRKPAKVGVEVLTVDGARFRRRTVLFHGAYKPGKRPPVCTHGDRRSAFHFAPENVDARKVFECPRSHAMHERSASNTSQANKGSNLACWTDWMVTSPTLDDRCC